jgi:histidinol-phosphate aminotransferase
MSDLPLRDDLVGAHPYGAPVDAVPVRLNVNENPYPPPESLVAEMAGAVAGAIGDANRYPDREAVRLREALAGYISSGAGVANVWPANGSNEVMHQILGAFGGPGRTVLSFAPTYSMYPLYARDTMTRYVTAPRNPTHHIDVERAAEALSIGQPSVVLLASPNNPTGGLLPLDDVARLHELVQPFGVLVVDEAYVEFAGPGASAVPLLASCPRLVVTRTLSKAFGMAGLRLGYAIAAPEIVDALRIVRLPYHLSALTQAAAEVAVRCADELLAPVTEVVTEREALARWLLRAGVPAAPSDANFVLIGPLGDSHGTFTGLLARGVLVRETGVPNCLRVSIGTPAENHAFREALAAVLDLNLEPDPDSNEQEPS